MNKEIVLLLIESKENVSQEDLSCNPIQSSSEEFGIPSAQS